MFLRDTTFGQLQMIRSTIFKLITSEKTNVTIDVSSVVCTKMVCSIIKVKHRASSYIEKLILLTLQMKNIKINLLSKEEKDTGNKASKCKMQILPLLSYTSYQRSIINKNFELLSGATIFLFINFIQ